MDSVSRPLSTTQALKGESVRPLLRMVGTNFASISSCGPHSAPAITRPWPSRYLVPECITRSAPNLIGCCRAGEQKQLSTSSSAPPAWAMSASAAMSQTSVSGLLGVSANSSRVLGRMAARHSPASVCETKVVSMPNLAKSWNSLIVEPNTPCEHTTWSPALSSDRMVIRMAAMPLAVAMQAPAPSSAARRRSIIVTVGLEKRL